MTLPLEVNTGSLIGGAWVNGPSSIDVINPATGGVLTKVSNATIEQCLAAVAAADRAFSARKANVTQGAIWRLTPSLMGARISLIKREIL